MRKMIFKCFVVLFFLQAVIGEKASPRRTSAGKRQIFSFGFHENNPVQKLTESGKSEMQGSKRSRRFLTSTLSLLWPQVFGPVDQGFIEERSYDEVPKTLLEYRLDMLRKKAQEEEETRLVIRNYMKSLTEAQDKFYGYPNNGEPGFAVINYI